MRFFYLIGVGGAGATAAPSGRSRADPAKRLVRQLGAGTVTSAFTQLRKIEQHPLLIRRLVGDAQVDQMAKLAHARSAHTGPTKCLLSRIHPSEGCGRFPCMQLLCSVSLQQQSHAKSIKQLMCLAHLTDPPFCPLPARDEAPE